MIIPDSKVESLFIELENIFDNYDGYDRRLKAYEIINTALYPREGKPDETSGKGLHKHVVSNNEAGFRLNAMYEKEVADKAKHYIPPISEVPFCPNCESDNTHENLLKHHYRCYDCGFAWAK